MSALLRGELSEPLASQLNERVDCSFIPEGIEGKVGLGGQTRCSLHPLAVLGISTAQLPYLEVGFPNPSAYYTVHAYVVFVASRNACVFGSHRILCGML